MVFHLLPFFFRYAKLVAKYPLAVLVFTTFLCTICILSVFLLTEIPEFSNPIKGFETRGTEISRRSLALKNLRLDLDHLSGQNNIFYRYPDEYELARNLSNSRKTSSRLSTKSKRSQRDSFDNENSEKRPIGAKPQRGDSNRGRDKTKSPKSRRIKMHEVDPRKPPSYCNTTPSQNGDEYAMLVFEVTDGSDLLSLSILSDLCELERRLWSTWTWDDGENGKRTSSFIPHESCQPAARRRCCQPWHVASVTAYLSDKSDCSQINETDVLSVKSNIDYCRQHASALSRCWATGDAECLRKIPVNCSSLPLYLLYQYILPKEYGVSDSALSSPPVTLMILPVAKSDYSSLTLSEVERLPSFLSTAGVKLVAMDFGIRDAVFQQYLLKDTIFGVLALLLVFAAMWVYSGSFLFTLSAMVGIDLSICVAYFVYRLVFRIDFFPFMNILTYVLVVGVGADDAFIFRSAWRKAKFEKNSGTHAKILSDTLSHAAVSMFVTSLTTAAAFYTNIISDIVVIKCFGIFAGTTILTNYLFMITWLPACVVLCEKRLVFSTSYCWLCPRWCIRQQRRGALEQEKPRTIINTSSIATATANERRRSSAFTADLTTTTMHILPTNSTSTNFGAPVALGVTQNHLLRSRGGGSGDDDEPLPPATRSRSVVSRSSGCENAKRIWSFVSYPFQRLYQQLSVFTRVFLHKLLPWFVIKLRYVWLVCFGVVAILAAVAVFYSPSLKLPRREYFQYFKPSHPFERWEDEAKQRFAFTSENRQMPMVMYVVWGVQPTSDAPIFDPDHTGTLEGWSIDNETEFFNNVNLVWFREFCSSMARQDFTHFNSLELPMLASCFVEDFMLAMRRRPCPNPSLGRPEDYCCADVTFPYPPGVFETCLRLFVSLHRSTITLFDMTSGLGPSGPLFSSNSGRPTGLVVMFTSKYNFTFSYSSMHEFYEASNKWVSDQLRAGPEFVRDGWLIADHLQLYDLQRALTSGTRLSVLIAVAIAFAVLFVTTWNPLISFLAILSISSVIVTTIAVLILLDWELNVLESTIIILTIGLSFDFTLHYGVAYKLCTTAEDRQSRVVYALGEVGSPVLMAFLTTFLAGAAMLPSTTLAYFQIGLFMMLETTISWLYATFFFTSLLHCVGPSGDRCQFDPRNLPFIGCAKRPAISSPVPGNSRRISRDIGADAALAVAARRKKSSIVSFNAVAFNSISCSSPLPTFPLGSKMNVLTPLDYNRRTTSRDYTSSSSAAMNDAAAAAAPNHSGWHRAITTVETEPMIASDDNNDKVIPESPELTVMSIEVAQVQSDEQVHTLRDNQQTRDDDEEAVMMMMVSASTTNQEDELPDDGNAITAKVVQEQKASIKERAASLLGPMIRRFSSKKSSTTNKSIVADVVAGGEDVELVRADNKDDEDKSSQENHLHHDVPFIDGDTSMQSIHAQAAR